MSKWKFKVGDPVWIWIGEDHNEVANQGVIGHIMRDDVDQGHYEVKVLASDGNYTGETRIKGCRNVFATKAEMIAVTLDAMDFHIVKLKSEIEEANMYLAGIVADRERVAALPVEVTCGETK